MTAFNNEHYHDETAGQAIGNLSKKKNKRLSAAIGSVRATLRVFGFDIVGRITLADRKTGKIYR